MPKRRLSAGLIGTAGSSAVSLCGAMPPWISRHSTMPAPRLLCCKPQGHHDKRHQDGRGHQWDGSVRDKANRSARK